MPDARHLRISRELFLAAFGADLGRFEPWVTDRLTKLMEEEDARVGDTLFSRGDPPEFFYFMREGRVQLVREGAPALILDGRHVFGMKDALLDRSRTHSAIAVTDLQLMRMRFEDWLELLDDSFELARASVAGLARVVAAYEEKLWLSDRANAPRAPGTTQVRMPERSEGADDKPGQVQARRLTIVERLALLMDAPFFRRSGVQPLSDLAMASNEAFFRRGETLLERGAPRDKVFLVVEGEVEASRQEPDLVRRFGAGEIVCGAAALAESGLAWRAAAATPTLALVVRTEEWFDLMEEHFDMVRSALGTLELRRDELQELLASKEQPR
jgi:CRP-like cAMP-binding protein